MLDKKAQKSLLDNAAEVNEIILGATVKHYVELQKGLEKAKEADKKTGDDFHEKLFLTANESQLIQTPKLMFMYGEPETGSTTKDPKFVVKQEIKESIKEIQDFMEQRKIDDEAVKEKLKIAKVAFTVSSTFRSSQTLKDLIGGDYFKNGDEKVYIDRNSTPNPIVAFSLPVKSDTDYEDYEFICMEFNFKNNTRSSLSITEVDAYDNSQYEPFNMLEKDNAEYKDVFAKKEKDEYFTAWSAAVKVTTPAPPSGSAKLFTFTHEKAAASYLSYEKTGSQKPSAITQVLASGATELYLPILRDGKLFYLYVNSKDDVDVKEIDGDHAPTGGVLNYEIDGHEVQVENINPGFYNWWLDGDYILNVPTPSPASVTRGSENLIELWKELTKNHGNAELSYADLPVGALFFSAKTVNYPTTLNGLNIVLETASELAKKTNPDPTHKLHITVNKKGEITGTDSTARLYGAGKLKIMKAEDAITFLKIGDNEKKFEELIASNSYLASEFAIVSTALPATAPQAPTAAPTSIAVASK